VPFFWIVNTVTATAATTAKAKALLVSGLPRATRRPRNDDHCHDNDNDKVENGILNTPNLRSKFHPFSTKRGLNGNGNDHDKEVNGFEGFCASATLHAE
jgi:hypothetical protein